MQRDPRQSGIDGMAWAKVGYRAITCWADVSSRWAADVLCMLLVKVCGLDLCMMFWEGFWVPQWLSLCSMKDLLWSELLADQLAAKMKFLLPTWNNSSPVVVVCESLVFTGTSISQAGFELRSQIILPYPSRKVWQLVNLGALGSAIQIGMSAFFTGLISPSCACILFLSWKFFLQKCSGERKQWDGSWGALSPCDFAWCLCHWLKKLPNSVADFSQLGTDW